MMITYYKSKNILLTDLIYQRKYTKFGNVVVATFFSGQQFYCPQKPSQMNFYKLHHESKNPWKFLKLKKMLQFVTFVTKTFPKILVNMLFMFFHIRFKLYINFTYFYLTILQFNSLIYIYCFNLLLLSIRSLIIKDLFIS